jgi:hypothetical protein
MRYRLFVLLVLIPALTPSAHAGILFGRKKDKPDPKVRVPELVTVLKSDKDADKRSHAAEELRTFDLAQFPEIVPALIDALQNDPKPSVRIEAVQSLGKLRPVSQVVGEALEQALAKDASMRVRLQARSTLLQYHWAGYRSGKKTDVPPLTPNREPAPVESRKYPPLIDTTAPPPSKPPLIPRLFTSPFGSKSAPAPGTNVPGSTTPGVKGPASPPGANAPGSPAPPKVTTKEPPLAPVVSPPPQLGPPPPAPAPTVPMPLPSGPTNPPPADEGPKLP